MAFSYYSIKFCHSDQRFLRYKLQRFEEVMLKVPINPVHTPPLQPSISHPHFSHQRTPKQAATPNSEGTSQPESQSKTRTDHAHQGFPLMWMSLSLQSQSTAPKSHFPHQRMPDTQEIPKKIVPEAIT